LRRPRLDGRSIGRQLQCLPRPLQRLIYRGGQRNDRLRDPAAVVAALRVRPGDRVADLGPGYGHFTLRLAAAVAPDGIVYAADASHDTLDDLAREARDRGITNVVPVLVNRSKLDLPEAVDLLFVSATYHHLREPVGYFTAVRTQLKPDGRVAILESRLEGVAARWMNPHGSIPRVVEAQMNDAGYDLTDTLDIVYGHWFAIYAPRHG
jgi:arsenite methyltransferase